MTDLTYEVVECVLAKVRAGDVPRDIVRAAAAEQPDNPDVKSWASAQQVAQRIVAIMIERELERRVSAGEIVARVDDDGETYYEPADD